MDGASATLTITNFTGLRETQIDSFTGQLTLSTDCCQITLTITFTETAANSRRFKALFHVGPGYDFGFPVVTGVTVGDPLPERNNPIIVEMAGPGDVLDAQRAGWQGTFFGQNWDIEKVDFGSDRYVFGTGGQQTAFMIAPDLPVEFSQPNIADGFTMEIPTAAQVLTMATSKPPTAPRQALLNLATVVITHVSVNAQGNQQIQEQKDCPKTGDKVQLYCLVNPNLPELKLAQNQYYVPFNKQDEIPTWQVKAWDGTYHFSVGHYGWIDALSRNVSMVAIPDNYEITYTWYSVTPERDTIIHTSPEDATTHGDGSQVAFPTVTHITAWDDVWNPTLTAVDGVHYYYCQVAVWLVDPSTANRPRIKQVADNKPFALAPFMNCTTRRTGTTPLVTKPTGISRANALTQIARLHKLMAGPRAGNLRTFAEWAYVHLNVVYGYGDDAKDKFVNEDCSGLVVACAIAIGNSHIPDPAFWGASYMAMLSHTHGDAGQVFKRVKSNDPKPKWEFNVLEDLDNVDLAAGDVIAHVRFNKRSFEHIVIISAPPTRNPSTGRYLTIPIIEAQGYDDVVRSARLDFHQSESQVVKHDYISQYLYRPVVLLRFGGAEVAPWNKVGSGTGADLNRVMATATEHYVSKFIVLRLKA